MPEQSSIGDRPLRVSQQKIEELSQTSEFEGISTFSLWQRLPKGLQAHVPPFLKLRTVGGNDTLELEARAVIIGLLGRGRGSSVRTNNVVEMSIRN